MNVNLDKTKLNKFLEALDAVRKDYTCGFCSQLCINPVTLSSCFHIICSDHYEGLKRCPTCNIPLEGGTTFEGDKELQNSIQATQKLCEIFERFRDSKAIDKKSGNNNKDNVKKPRNRNKTVVENINKFEKKSNLNTSTLSSCSRINNGIEKKNTKGETPLHVSCRTGKVEQVLELLNQGANSNTKDHAGWTPLHEAVQNGNIDLVKVLLQFNTLINVPGPSNETPLHEAIRYKHKVIAAELVKNGADLHAKNCKGETPLELAAEGMKTVLLDAAENILQTQGINISHIANIYSELDLDDIKVYCSSGYRTVVNKLKALVKHHTNLHIEAKFNKKVTHIIVDTEEGICVSNLDVLQGIVNGVWILSSEWATKSTENKLEPFEAYEVKGVGNKIYNGPLNSRYNKYKQLPGLFNGCHFYFYNFSTQYKVSKSLVLTKDVLNKIVNDGGGVVLRRVPNPESIPDEEQLVPYHAKRGGKLEICSHFIIFKDMYEPMYNMAHIKALPIGWFIECIEKYELCEPW